MNKNLERALAQEERNRAEKKRMNRVSLAFAVVVLAVFFVYNNSSANKAQSPDTPASSATASPTGSAAPSARPVELPWELLVVNRAQRLPEGYSPALANVGDEKVDERVLAPLREMTAAAADSGITLKLCSGYRSVEDQNELFEEKLKEIMAEGFKQEAAVLETEKYLQPPGASEHHTGLGLDLLSEDYFQLDEGFAETEAYLWLKAHAAEYGFIERYPKGKEEVTGVEWEPWHYRYVGKDFAARIGDRCLEEYVEQNYSGS